MMRSGKSVKNIYQNNGVFHHNPFLGKLLTQVLRALFIIITLIFTSSCQSFSGSTKNTLIDDNINKDIIEIKDFNICSESTELNTSVKGTVFIKSKDNKIGDVQIVAFIDVDTNDWGGISIYLSDEWGISSVKSSYAQNRSTSDYEDFIEIFSTFDSKYTLNQMIRIGRGMQYIPVNIGAGVVIIDLELKDLNSNLKSFDMMIGVGSDEENGVMIENPDSIFIQIPFSENNK